jgi:hypothetical protein
MHIFNWAGLDIYKEILCSLHFMEIKEFANTPGMRVDLMTTHEITQFKL